MYALTVLHELIQRTGLRARNEVGMTLPHMENEQKIEFPYPVVILWNINELKYEQEKLEHVPIEVL